MDPVGSTVGDVKATLKRRLKKLAEHPPRCGREYNPHTPELSRLLRLYSSDSIDTTGMTFENSFTSVLPVSSRVESRDSA